MAGLVVPAIHGLLAEHRRKDVDARDKRRHDAAEVIGISSGHASPDISH
jgi:hypothetical protein